MAGSSDRKVDNMTRLAMAASLKPIGDPLPSVVAQGFKDVPARAVADQAQYLQNILLPRIKAKSGETSADYQFFTAVWKSLLYLLIVLDGHETLNRRYTHVRLLLEFWERRANDAERELDKYNAAGSIVSSEFFDAYLKAAANRAADLLNQKSK